MKVFVIVLASFVGAALSLPYPGGYGGGGGGGGGLG